MDKNEMDQLVQDIISAGRFNGANLLELAICCYNVELSCIATVAADIGDVREFSETVDRVRRAIEGVGDAAE